MCGIAAVISTSGCELRSLIHPMVQAIRHRGPDDEGFAFFLTDGTERLFGGPDTPRECYASKLPYAAQDRLPERLEEPAFLALGHRRLSIVDLTAAGHQPMSQGDSGPWITYNGEIYNHVELREELSQAGYTFHSRSDTEVLLAAYAAWGDRCLERLNGMFAFVLWDPRRKALLAARDRFGIKPLYYWISPAGFLAMASEIKQFATLPGWHPTLNSQRAYDFLNWGVLDHTDQTLFDGVFQIRGGEALRLNLGETRTLDPRGGLFKWYELQPRPFSGAPAEAAQEFRRLLTDSVGVRLRADVPAGSCLSGGLDSSSIVCLMHALLDTNDRAPRQKTFSACSTVPAFDERAYVDEVVALTGTDAHYTYPDEAGLFASLDRVTRHQDEPFGSTSVYAQWEVFRLAASEGVKVMLDGQGADEQLAGYHSFYGVRFSSLFRGLQWATLSSEMRWAQRLHGPTPTWAVARLVDHLLPEVFRQPLRRRTGRSSVRSGWLDLDRLGAAGQDPVRAAGTPRLRSIREMSVSQLTATSLPMLLHWEDRNSMAHSIEARVPFLDHRLVEFVLGLGDDLKIHQGQTKQVLREGMQGVLPERIRNRTDKIGFATPEEAWLREHAPERFRAALEDAVEAAGGIIRADALRALDEVVGGRRPFDASIWRWISFGRWLRLSGIRP